MTTTDIRPHAPAASAISFGGLRHAAWRAGLGVVAPFVTLLLGYAAIRTIGSPLLASMIIAGLSVATVVLALKRSEYLSWAMYLQGLNVFAFLWERADNAGMPLQWNYALAADRAIGLGMVPTVWLQQHFYTFGSPGIHDWAFTAVYMSFFAAPHLALLVLWQRNRMLAHTFVTALLATLFLGLAVIAVLPTAPPWMAAEAGMTPPVHRVVRNLTDDVNESAYQQGEEIVGSNDVAAMPSLHMAMAVLIAMLAHHGNRRLRWWPALYPAAMGFALVYLGEHYVVDIIAGVATAAVGWRAAHLILARGRPATVAELASQPALAAREAA